jgi:hypothetical protein
MSNPSSAIVAFGKKLVALLQNMYPVELMMTISPSFLNFIIQLAHFVWVSNRTSPDVLYKTMLPAMVNSKWLTLANFVFVFARAIPPAVDMLRLPSWKSFMTIFPSAEVTSSAVEKVAFGHAHPGPNFG